MMSLSLLLFIEPALITYITPSLSSLTNTTALMNCNYRGLPTPKIHWRRLSLFIDTNTTKYSIGIDGSLYVHNVQWSDVGDYHCVVSNEYGEDIGVSVLTVQGKGRENLKREC